jgi:hypothetical protein
MEVQRTLDENPFFFSMLRIRKTAFDGADRLASLAVVETHTLSATFGVDYIDLVTLADRVVWALRLALAAIDTHIGNVGRHGFSKPLVRSI